MDLGTRLKQARLEAGLSQRQLCGEEITRNMLSQIENGSARPSMDTLRYLAARLEKPMGFFLEEEAVTSPNREVMEKARQATTAQALEILKDYRENDPVYDRERWLIEAAACLAEAKNALAQGKPGYCATLLEQCALAGAKTPYYNLESQRLFLCYQAGALSGEGLWNALGPDTQTLLQLCRAAISAQMWEKAEGLLLLASDRPPKWHQYMGKCCMARQDYNAAIHHLTQAEDCQELYRDLELCYSQLEDYKQAYFYACKQKHLSPIDYDLSSFYHYM